MLPDEKACVARTGFNGGLDVIFGNGGFGAIPEVSSRISIYYVQSDGSEGNIYRRTRDDWKIIDDVLDGNGDTIDLTKVFTIDIFTDINFGADKEDINRTDQNDLMSDTVLLIVRLPANSANNNLSSCPDLPQQAAKKHWIEPFPLYPAAHKF